MSEQVVIEGLVENIIFQSNENGYSVFSVASDPGNVVCVGYVTDLRCGESIKVTGSFVVHPAYGRQLSIKVFEKSIPTTIDGMEKYLGSGVIKGVGSRMAKRIVATFGDNTFKIIEDEPDKLAKIRGISLAKALSISAAFHEQASLRSAMIFLQGYGISSLYAMKIFKLYKERTFDIVKTNPYRLADDIYGIGFKMADSIAEAVGIEKDSSFRIKAGIKFTLNQASINGHCFLPRNILIEKSSELLDVSPDFIENLLMELQLDRQIWIESLGDFDAVYLNAFYYAELSVAKKLLELASPFELNGKNVDSEIEQFEKENDISLHDNQREAVKQAMTNGVLVITGGPGTGKTTTINTIISLLIMEDNEIALTAPTGRAAKRMTEATGMQAQTIHRLLETTFVSDDSRRQKFERNEDKPIEADAVIVDESSMVDILLANSLLKAISVGTRLIIVGDSDQLPSVGPGNFLKDIIRSNCIKVVKLTEIFRQAAESAIVMNAHRINKGQYPTLNEKNKDFFFIRRPFVEPLINTILELTAKRLPKYMECNSISDIQVLTPMKKSPIGVHNLNLSLQKTLNPPSSDKEEREFRNTVFREGDKVMQIKNNYNMVWNVLGKHGEIDDTGVGVFNGDTGIILEINSKKEVLTVVFDDGKIVDYDFTQLEELELAYAITIHKSQGSEYPIVVIPIYQGPRLLMSRNLLYTAVTRAKKLVVIVGIEETINKMVDNSREIQRYSSLAQRIIHLNEFIGE